MVAALVKGAEDEENWILAEVVSFDTTTHKYEVDDIDEEQKDKHILSKRRVVPLPLMRANPGTDLQALFPVGSVGMLIIQIVGFMGVCRHSNYFEWNRCFIASPKYSCSRGEDHDELVGKCVTGAQVCTVYRHLFHLRCLPAQHLSHAESFFLEHMLFFNHARKVHLRPETCCVFMTDLKLCTYLLTYLFSVMALYPQTTCFYKAVVKQLPRKSTDEYEVLFEDTSYTDGYSPPFTVAQRYVIAIKDKKKQ